MVVIRPRRTLLADFQMKYGALVGVRRWLDKIAASYHMSQLHFENPP